MIEAEVIMRSDVRIRPANRSDEAFVHRTTGRLAAFGPPAWRTPDEIVEAERRTLRAFFIESPTDTALLIAESDTPLGFVYLETQVDYFTGEPHGHVGIIAVDDVAEGRGIGKALLEAAGSWARTRGFRRLTLNVFAGNERARRLYEHAGFEPETLRYVRAV
jgi:GNAT superfamily N-acetyltransferase